MAWLYVPGAVDSSLESDLHSETIIAASVTSKGKPMPPQRWRRGWNKGGWLRLLSGMTLSRSTANRGVAEWISSLEVSPVSHSPPRDACGESMTSGTSGPPSPESSGKSNPTESSWRMFQASCGIIMNEFGETYERWVTRLRRVSSQRQKQAHLTNGSDYLSLRTQQTATWPTPTSGHPSNANSKRGADTLYGTTTNWPTPTTADTFTNNLESSQVREGSMHSVTLPRAAGNWPTPNAGPQNDSDTTWKERRQRIKEQGINGNGFGLTLGMAATNWPTPSSAMTAGYSERENCASHTKAGGHVGNEMLRQAVDQAQNWPTPDSRSIPQAPTTTQDGHTCSPSCRRLNPRFVEMLIGWPDGWSLVDSQCSATEWFLWKQRMRTALSMLK